MLTGELKQELIIVLQKLVSEHRKRRAAVTDDLVKHFMSQRPMGFDWINYLKHFSTIDCILLF